jgi:thiol-disulfide isomerase/thioredoxin
MLFDCLKKLCNLWFNLACMTPTIKISQLGFPLLIALSLLGATALFAQAPKVSGQLRNLNNGTVVLSYTTNEIYPEVDTIAVDKNGSFSVSLEKITKPTYARLTANDKWISLFLGPGYNIRILADADSLRPTVSISGAGSLASNYLKVLNTDTVLKKYAWSTGRLYASGEAFFLACERYRSVQDSLLHAFYDMPGNDDLFWPEFANTEHIKNIYTEAIGLVNYYERRNKGIEDLEFLYNKYVAPLLASAGNVDEYYHIGAVRDYSYHHFNSYQLILDTARNKVSIQKDGFYGAAINSAFNHLEGKRLIAATGRLLFLLLMVTDGSGFSSYPDRFIKIDSLINRYATIADNREHVQWLRKYYAGIPKGSTIVSKEHTFNLPLTDVSGQSFPMSNLFGKRLLISVWASWCGPCIQKFETFRKLKPKLDSANITLLFLNVDDNMTLWNNAIKKHQPPGMQYYANGGMNGPFSQLFGIIAIPRTLFFDEAGNCLNQFVEDPENLSYVKR